MIKGKCSVCGCDVFRKKLYKGVKCEKCHKEFDRIKRIKKIYGEMYDISMKCRKCGEKTLVRKYAEKSHAKKGGPMCQKCCNERSSLQLKALRASQTPEERSAFGKLSRSKASKERMSEGVKKQWETIRSSTEHFAKVCKAKSVRMKKVWENYSEETKNHIVEAFCKSYGKSRSKSSEALKCMMIDEGLFRGFVSEEVFHGFVPDEINHNLKVIVEMYGDLYHCNPRKYKDPEYFVNAIKRKVKEQWQRDRRRLACFYKHGYSVVIVWDSDFRKNPQREIERIRDEIDKKRNSL